MDICIYGASSANLEKTYYEGAEALGLEIARAFLATSFEGARHLRRISQFDTLSAPSAKP